MRLPLTHAHPFPCQESFRCFTRGSDLNLSSTSPLQSPCQAEDANLKFIYSQLPAILEQVVEKSGGDRVRFTCLD